MTLDPQRCPHRLDGHCVISCQLGLVPVPLAEDACAECSIQDYPQTFNRVTASKALYVRRLKGLEPIDDIRPLLMPPDRNDGLEGFGVGTELKGIIVRWQNRLARIGLEPLLRTDPSCGCDNMRDYMDVIGVEACDRRQGQLVDSIVDKYLDRHPAAHTVRPLLVTTAHRLLRKAIKIARRKLNERRTAPNAGRTADGRTWANPAAELIGRLAPDPA